jgi:UDP-N-acetylglucosamine acyltransferase
LPHSLSPLSQVHPDARIGDGVVIGPFCLVGPYVSLGEGTVLDSHVSIMGHTTIGRRNRFWPGCVIGAEPQDKSYIQFREGVTVNRGADKEDGVTRIGDRNLLMSNAHVAHNCRIFNDTTLVNGVLLGGHAHVHDRAIISGNSAVHHFATVGRLAFVAGCSKVVRDVPPFLLSSGADENDVRTLNLVGLQRAGISVSTIAVLKQAFRLLYREHKTLASAREHFAAQLDGVYPIELLELFEFLERSRLGKMGRGREVLRGRKFDAGEESSAA